MKVPFAIGLSFFLARSTGQREVDARDVVIDVKESVE